MQHLSEALAEGGLVTANDRSRVLISGMNHRGRYRCQPSRPPGKARRPTRTGGLRRRFGARSPSRRQSGPYTHYRLCTADELCDSQKTSALCPFQRADVVGRRYVRENLWRSSGFRSTRGSGTVRYPRRCERKKKARNNSCSAWLRRGWSTRSGRAPSTTFVSGDRGPKRRPRLMVWDDRV